MRFRDSMIYSCFRGCFIHSIDGWFTLGGSMLEAQKDLATMRIREVSRLTQLSPSALRKYEALGLVLPYSEHSGHRLFSFADVDWLGELKVYLNADGHTPQGVAARMRLIPFHEIRVHEIEEVCDVRSRTKVCWQVHADDPAWRRKCRACPGYIAKNLVLNFEDSFQVHYVPDARDPGARKSGGVAR